MSEQQTKQAEELFNSYTEAKNWWEGLIPFQRDLFTDLYFNGWDAESLTIGQINEIWAMEKDKPKEKPLDESLFDSPNVAALKKENELMRKALEQIAGYDRKDLTLVGAYANVTSIASVALFHIQQNQIK